MKKKHQWPAEYETPKVYSIDTAFQQALGITYSCASGNNPDGDGCSVGDKAAGGTDSCVPGGKATGDGKNSCGAGNKAK